MISSQTKLKELFWLHVESHSSIINTAHPWSHFWLLVVQKESFGSMAPRHVLYYYESMFVVMAPTAEKELNV